MAQTLILKQKSRLWRCFKCHKKRSSIKGMLCKICVKNQNKHIKFCIMCGTPFKSTGERHTRKYYCSIKCKDNTVYASIFLTNLKAKSFDVIYQARQLGLVALKWKKARQPVLVEMI